MRPDLRDRYPSSRPSCRARVTAWLRVETPSSGQGDPGVPGQPGAAPGYSLRAVSGPVIRSSTGKVEAMIPREAASPASTMT